MNRFKKVALSLLMAAPIMANAAGMGLYVPFNLTETEKVEYDYTYGTYEFDYRPSAGIGIAFDSNIGRDRLFNYRFGFEYSKTKTDDWWGQDIATLTKEKFNFVNTFGFGLVRTRDVRLWVGPRINIQFQNSQGELRNSVEYASIEQSSFGIGLAAAAGVNVNLGRVVSLAADLDYHAVTVAGTEDYTYYNSFGYYVSNSEDFTGTNKGVTARFYLLFRFGR